MEVRSLELLAPAKNLECGIAAIEHGADAVYIGAQRFGARVAAGNSIEDIAQLCHFAHQYGAKVYVTVNTIIYDEEMEDTLQLVKELETAGVDALLVQDMGIVQMAMISSEWKIPIHASTQTDNRTVEKVLWLHSLGFKRVVLARELSIEEISAIHVAVPDVELEAFVHGALCVSYSGVCYASQYCFGRSANRGECAQFCRMKFDLLDSDGVEIEHQRHLLSLRDMCRIDHLEELAAAGVCSFKIEGRLKDLGYVKNVVSAYSQRLDKLVSLYPNRYCRASKGTVTYTFEPNLKKTFNRGFTTYFLHERRPDIASFDTPKAMGEYVGKVKEIRGNSFNVAGTASFANGDGLCFINDNHELEGFRVNRVEGNRLFPLKMPANLHPGSGLYRNNDVAFERLLAGKTAERRIPVRMEFMETSDGFTLRLDDVEVSMQIDKQLAQKPQRDNIVRQLTKLGNTLFVCDQLDIIGDADRYFIPSSMLAELRRKVVEEKNIKMANSGVENSVCQKNLATEGNPSCISSYPFPYLYNIANKEARMFYEEHGLNTIAPAFELVPMKHPLLMQCRHCIRYSLGFCVKRGGRKPEWKEPLSLVLGDGRKFRLEFDCRQCQMNVYGE